MIIIDAKGKECPIPVVLTKKEMDGGAAEITTYVDNETAKGNLERLAASAGYDFSVTEKDGIFIAVFTKSGAAPAPEKADDCNCGCEEQGGCTCKKNWVMFIGKACIGEGSDELGGNLMKMMLFTLAESDNIPEYVLLMNGGVKLASENKATVEHLQKLADKGVKILVCGTCLNYFGLTEQLEVGTVSNMYDILSKMQDAGKVVSF